MHSNYLILSFLVFSLMVFNSCRKKEVKINIVPANEIITPISMLTGETPLDLADFIEPGFVIDSVSGDESLTLFFDKDSQKVVLEDQGALPPISIFSLYSNGMQVDVPLYKSRKKKLEFSFDPGQNQYESVQIVGEMNAWNPANTPLIQNDGVWMTTFYLLPGEYGYQMVLDGNRSLDFTNPDSIGNGMGGFNSKLSIKAIPEGQKPVIELLAHQNNSVSFRTVNAGEVLALWDNSLVKADLHQDHYDIRIPEEAKMKKRSNLRVWAFNAESCSNYTLIPLNYGNVVSNTQQLTREDWQTNIMYFVLVDRFNNGSHENDWTIKNDSINPKANYQGGDLVGITQKIQSGYFDQLGVNNIWLSPIVKNPEGAFGFYNKGGIMSKFSGYHGYWPISFTKLNPHFGDETQLKELIGLAHEKNYNILLDFVANHVHELHPVYQANKDKDWATNLYLPDGTLNTEKWDEYRLTTWFDVFLPSLNLEKPEITEMLADSALYWLQTYGFDGFRHDATKHIPEIFWRTLTKKIKRYEVETGKGILQLGETYGTPELINSYISSGMLDGQFDFNVFDAVSTSIVMDNIGFESAAARIKQSQEYYGTNHIMGNISGNQDRTRFMALATGDVRLDEDSKYAGWSRDITKKTPEGYQKLAMLHAVNMTIPGIPVIYYGDEIGLTGGNDPDNRRMMYFDNWNTLEKDLFQKTAMLTKLRKSKMSLLYGDLHFLLVEPQVMVYCRRYFDDSSIIFINNSPEQKKLQISVPEFLNTEGLQSHFGASFNISPGKTIEISLAPLSFEVLHN